MVKIKIREERVGQDRWCEVCEEGYLAGTTQVKLFAEHRFSGANGSIVVCQQHRRDALYRI